MVTIFALAAALLYGSADFLGGAASRRAHTLAVLMVAEPFGAAIVLAASLAAGGVFPATGLGWALAGGATGAAGLIVFYEGLAAGPMSVVAPVSAVVSTLLPVSVAFAAGERQGPGVYAGALICLAAIVLISMQGQPGSQPTGSRRKVRAIGYGAVSGLAFGLYFLFLKYAGASGVFGPVVAARLAGTAIMLAAGIWMGVRPGLRSMGPKVLLAAAASGVIDAAANVCYVVAARAGLLGIAVILTSLYPGITVLLARFVLGERMRPVQRLGLTLAALGVVLVTV